MTLAKKQFSKDEWKLWRNEFLYYMFFGFGPFYEFDCGVLSGENWKVEADQQWEQWKEDLENGEDPRWKHLWQHPQLN